MLSLYYFPQTLTPRSCGHITTCVFTTIHHRVWLHVYFREIVHVDQATFMVGVAFGTGRHFGDLAATRVEATFSNNGCGDISYPQTAAT